MDVKQYLIEYVKSLGYVPTDATLIETLHEEKSVYSALSSRHRWWDIWLEVVKIGDKFIGYYWARANGDIGIFDLGWEFNWNTVVEYVPKEITMTVYVPKE